MSTARLSWPPIVAEAARIALAYSTPPTLRQVFYRLVAAGVIPNTSTAYKSLSNRTAVARRAGWFPRLSDGTRRIDRPNAFDDPADGLASLIDWYRLDRTRGQSRQVWVVLEKATLTAMATAATERFGVPVLALRGYGSQTAIDTMADEIESDGRPVAVFYVGDFDPSGEDIERDIINRLGIGTSFTRIAVQPSQVSSMNLSPMPGKATDSRAAAFAKRHGSLIQVEAEAIDPAVLESMVHDAVESITDLSVLSEVEAREAADLDDLEAMRQTVAH